LQGRAPDIKTNAVPNPPSPLKNTGSNNNGSKIKDSSNVMSSFFDNKKIQV
jgi:hypothetical protein